jgi:hypothetical protein
VCRSRAERPTQGRRCPGQSDPYRRTLARIRQRIGRHDRAVRQAAERGDWATMERHISLLDRDVALHEHHHQHAGPPATVPAEPVALPDTVAGQFTPAATVDWSDDELILVWAELADDPAAQDQIMATLEWRAQAEAARDAELAQHAEHQRAERDARERAWQHAHENQDASPLTNPARRPARRLSPERACREEYDAHLAATYVTAETECRGQLLSREGLAKGIDPRTLFTGPASRVRVYASEELRTWFGRHGRITFAEWKYNWFGRDSDRDAARTARHQSMGEVTA